MSRRKVLSQRLPVALLCICAIGLLNAVAAEPDSMSEARAMDDPAASASVHSAPELIIYKGEQISEATWHELGLACMETRTKFICRDSVGEFDSSPIEAASRKKGGASASAGCA